MQIAAGKKIYFLSDFHLGVPGDISSIERERKIIRFLDKAIADAAQIFIVGDLFDFWYEYKTVVPRGYTRILGKLAQITDNGIPMHFFVGNHDMWMNDYFTKELNIPIYFEPKEFTFNDKKFLIGHGDGLGPGDSGYKFLKKIFRNPVCQWLFGVLPPYFGMGLASYFSRKSRAKAIAQKKDTVFLGEEKEWLIIYCKEVLQKQHIDFFVFGHRHLPINFNLNKSSLYINLGDWLQYYSYAVFDGQQLELKYYQEVS
jgi:UDP-2,3-diacylglucosamine hydrolase